MQREHLVSHVRELDNHARILCVGDLRREYLRREGESVYDELDILQRLAKLESRMDSVEKKIDGIDQKLNGYLDHRIEVKIEAFIGRLLITAIVSSGLISALVTWLLSK